MGFTRRELRAHRERGQAMVETAITLPLLLLLLMGIMEFGWYFYNQMSVENGSREGARYAIVNSDSATLSADVTDLVEGIVVGPGEMTVSVSLVSDKITVTVTKDVATLTPIAAMFTTGNTFELTSSTQMKIA